jgi:hypothetical protein
MDDVGDVDNIDDWRLDITTGHWTRLTHRQLPRFEIFREGKTPNHLWEMRRYKWSKEMSWHDMREREDELLKALGALPDLAWLSALYETDIATQSLGEDEEQYGIYRIRIGDVIVRYKEDRFIIQVTVEAELPENIVEQLQRDLLDKLSLLERAAFTCKVIAPQ